MNNYLAKCFRNLLLYCLTVVVACTSEHIDLSSANEKEVQDYLIKAEQFLNINQNDSVLAYLSPLVIAAQKVELQNATQNLKVRLMIAKANEQNNHNVTALLELKELIEETRKQKLWTIYTESALTLARLYHKMQRFNLSKQQLETSKVIIDRFELDQYVLEWIILNAHWHEEVGSADSTTYYIDLVSHTLDLTNSRPNIQAEYYMIKGLLSSRQDLNQTIQYFQTAVDLIRPMNDNEGLMLLYHLMSREYGIFNQDDQSLVCSDSAMVAAYRAIAKGQLNSSHVFVSVNSQRRTIYKNLGQPDSALYYVEKGNGERLRYTRDQERFRFRELDVQSTNQQQSLLLQEQEQQIKTDRAIQILLFSVIFLAVVLLILIVRNYQKQKQTNQQLAAQAQQLAQLDQMKSRFFANASHELRTPLTLMLAPIKKLLQDDHLTPKQHQMLNIAARNGKQLQQLTTEILNLRKLELGNLEVTAHPTLLYDFFSTHCAQFTSLADSKGIEYIIDVQIDRKVIGQIDQEKCRQLIYNLLSNAFKFTPSGGQIRCHVALQNGHLKFEVSDTGEGIHRDDLPHVFNRYFQTNRPEKPIEGGTGIGLALCKEYVELFDGKMEVKSALNQGSTFSAKFPIEIKETAVFVPNEITTPLVKNTSIATKKSNHQTHILIVEDHPDLGKYLKMVLSDHYQVTLVENGQAAWEYLFTNENESPASKCDLILSDLMMPVMDGYQLSEKLKSHNATRHIPVVMLTARAELRDKLKALRIGVDDYLTKPFEEEELLVRIQNLLERQTIKKELQTEDKKAVADISQEDQDWLLRFETYVQQQLSSDLLSVSLLADEFAMSEPTLFRQTKRLTGLSPLQYIKEVRLNKALHLLETQTYNSVSKVAYEVGYADHSAFARAFKKRFGKSPSGVMG
ncbi:MAG: response regulator [Bacteroidota bacterium]